MCGIVALLSFQDSIDSESLKRATQCLHHRGPDGQKCWISPTCRVGLGHARLSIIDLKTGDQPISNQDNNLHIVVNGEFYDFERIQQDLERWGYQLRTRYCWRTQTEITSAILKPVLWSFRSDLPCPLSMNQLRLFQAKRGVSL